MPVHQVGGLETEPVRVLARDLRRQQQRLARLLLDVSVAECCGVGEGPVLRHDVLAVSM